MDREELERLGMSVPGLAAKIKAYQNEPTAQRRKDIVSVILDAVLPAYDAMRDAEWEQVGWQLCASAMHPGELVPNDGSIHAGRCPDCVPLMRRVGKEGGS